MTRVPYNRGYVFCRRCQNHFKRSKCDKSKRGTLVCPIHHNVPVRVTPHHDWNRDGIKANALKALVRGRPYIVDK